MRRSPLDDCFPYSVNLGGVVVGDRPRWRLIKPPRSHAGLRYRLPGELPRLKSPFVIPTKNLPQCRLDSRAVIERAQVVLRPMVKKQPQFETRVANGSINALASRFPERLYQIRNVRARTAMVDI